MKTYFKTEGGTLKQFSEDRVLVGKEVYHSTSGALCIDNGLIAVADGVGGNRAGAVAAQQVCTMLAEFDLPSEADFKLINERLIERSARNENWRGMATTLTGLCVQESGAYAFHVGNTRLYSIQAGKYLKQLTVDDTVVDYLVRTGKISEEDALTHPKRNEITACFGGNSGALLSIATIELDVEKQPFYLLTCDGIHETLSVDDMEDIIAECDGDWTFVVDRLVNEAKAHGSTDDCTAVVVDCHATDAVVCEKEEEEENGPEISEEHHNCPGSTD